MCGAERVSVCILAHIYVQTIVPVCGITRSRYLQGSHGALQRRNARVGLIYLSHTFAFELTHDAKSPRCFPATAAIDVRLPMTMSVGRFLRLPDGIVENDTRYYLFFCDYYLSLSLSLRNNLKNICA